MGGQMEGECDLRRAKECAMRGKYEALFGQAGRRKPEILPPASPFKHPKTEFLENVCRMRRQCEPIGSLCVVAYWIDACTHVCV